MPANPLETALKLTGMYFPTVLSIANYRKDESAAYWNFSDGISSFLARLDESTLTWQKLGEAESLDQRIGRDKSIQEYGYTLTSEKFVQIYGEGYERQSVTEESKPALVTTLGIGGTQALMSFLQQGAGSMPRENALAVLTTVFGVSRADAEAMVPEPQEEEPGVESQLAGIFGGGDGNGNGNGAAPVEAETAPPEAAPVEASEPVEFRSVIDRVLKWNDLELGIEYLPGQVRFRGSPHARKLRSAYGHVRKYYGADKEALDIYVSPALLNGEWKGTQLFAVSQLSLEDGDFDEYKLMAGWDSAETAKQAYIQEMTPDHFGGIEAVDLEWLQQFKKSATVADSEPEFAEREKDVIDRFLEQATEQVQPFVNGWVQQIQAQIETIAAKDISDTEKYAELEQTLEQVYPNLSVSEFAEVLGTAMLAAQLAGRYEVLEGIRDG